VVDGGTLRIQADRFTPGSDGRGTANVMVSAGLLDMLSTANGCAVGSTSSSLWTQTGGSTQVNGNGTGTKRDLNIAGTAASVKTALTVSDGSLTIVGSLKATGAPALTGFNNFNFNGGTLTTSTIDVTNLTYSSNLDNPVLDAIGKGTLASRGGTLAPGDVGKVAKLTVIGAYSETPSSNLSFDLTDITQTNAFQHTATWFYDFVTVSGTASLGGQLDRDGCTHLYAILDRHV
jgi:hypothetical protein